MSLTTAIVTGRGALLCADTRLSTLDSEKRVIGVADGYEKVHPLASGWMAATGEADAAAAAMAAIEAMPTWDAQAVQKAVEDAEAAWSPGEGLCVSIVRDEGYAFSRWRFSTTSGMDAGMASGPKDFTAHLTFPGPVVGHGPLRDRFGPPLIAAIKSKAAFDNQLMATVTCWFAEVHESGATEHVGPEATMAILVRAEGGGAHRYIITEDARNLTEALANAPRILEGLREHKAKLGSASARASA